MNEPETRRIECHACGADVMLPLQYDLVGPDVHCAECGVLVSSHAEGLAAAKRLGGDLTIDEATAITMRHTYEEVTNIARKLYADPSSGTPGEVDVMTAFLLLRALDLPCHAPKRSN